MIKSDFGKGLVICLVKFAEHFENEMGMIKLSIFDKWIKSNKEDKERLDFGFPYNQSLKMDIDIANKVYNANYKKYLSRHIELFMNGASDHLYDIEVPQGKEWDKIRKKVTELQNKSLEIGHGFRFDKIWTIEDLSNIIKLIREIALMIDKQIGLKPDLGRH